MSYRYTLGADPEMFVRSKANGLIVPVCGLVGGTKKEPLAFSTVMPKLAPKGFLYQEDNVTFEVNIPAYGTKSDFAFGIEKVLLYSDQLLESKGLKRDLTRSAVRFEASQLASEQAQTIGCDPDFCAYGGDDDKPVAREPFDIKTLGTWRFAGGHVHFGYDKSLGIPEHVVVRLIDALVYLPIIEKDKQKMRRHKYGLAGLYRPKKYGVEYRTMSNFWLSTPFEVSRRAFNLLMDIHGNLDQLCALYQALDIEKVNKCVTQSGEGQLEIWNEITRLPHFWDLCICDNGPSNKLYSLPNTVIPPTQNANG